jgi:hypothetical protein
MSKSKGALLALLVMTNVTCGDAPMVAAPGSTLTVIANPPFIVANGGVSVVSAVVIDPAGTPAANGTVVLFLTTLGSIEAQGETKDGVARVNLVADSRSGTATVTGITGDQTATVDVEIGSARPALVTVTANPARITRSISSGITANVFDENGNPIANVPVVFRLDGGTGRETLDSAGAQTFTDTNGQAFDTLRTSSNGSADVTVTAETSNQVSDSIDVEVN